jgi:RNA recognition motif-containing protein
MNIYISNLDSAIDNESLKKLFAPYGEVRSAQVVMDVFTGVSRGFGYVEMADEQAKAAIQKLDQTVVNSLTISVKEAPPVQDKKGSYKVGSGTVDPYRFKKN